MNDDTNKKPNNCIVRFFSEYNKVITGVASVLGLLGIFLTCYQISETKIQIRANTSYQIHKDGREIFKTISPEIIDIITNKYPDKNYKNKSVEIAKTKINEVLMYYASLYKQYEYENIDESSWLNISKEFCQFLNQKMVNEFWNDRIVNTKMWNKNYIEYGSQCLNLGG